MSGTPVSRTTPGTVIIEGVPAIARACGRSRRQIYRWIKSGFLPAGKLPKGAYAVTPGMIERMILAARDAEKEKSGEDGKT